jgi:diacylglycerol kinase family enzyme
VPLPEDLAPSPVVLVCNAGAAGGANAQAREAAVATVQAAGRACEVLLAERGEQLPALAAQGARRVAAQGGVLVGAGGDGTLNTVARAALNADVAFGVLPLGTFNYFARAHQLPEEPVAAAQGWLSGFEQRVQVGVVNDEAFLVNASIGLYPKLLRAREADNRQYGRHRLVAAWAALRTVWNEQRSLRLALRVDGQAVTLRTPTLFVGNNALQFEQLGLPEAEAVADGDRLGLITVRPVSRWRMLWLGLRGALGELDGAAGVIKRPIQTLEVAPRRGRGRGGGRIELACDGEVRSVPLPLRFEVRPASLRLVRPVPASAMTAEPAAG